MQTTTTLNWNDAVFNAMEPTELDHSMIKHAILNSEKNRINDEGKLADPALIRERATKAYIDAHEGEHAEIEFTDPLFADNLNRGIFRVSGTLEKNYVRVPRFHNADHPRTVLDGFVVGGTLIPFTGVSAIRVDGDHSVVVL